MKKIQAGDIVNLGWQCDCDVCTTIAKSSRAALFRVKKVDPSGRYAEIHWIYGDDVGFAEIPLSALRAAGPIERLALLDGG